MLRLGVREGLGCVRDRTYLPLSRCGFREVLGVGFRDSGLGVGVWDLGCRVQSPGVGVQGLGSRVWFPGFGVRGLAFGASVLGVGFWIWGLTWVNGHVLYIIGNGFSETCVSEFGVSGLGLGVSGLRFSVECFIDAVCSSSGRRILC